MLNKKKDLSIVVKMSKQGDKKIIIIPKSYHKVTDDYTGKKFWITFGDVVDDEGEDE